MDTQEDQAVAEPMTSFRADFRRWIESNLPAEWRDISRGTEEERAVAIRRSWGEALARAGWAAPGWPVAAGGRGLPLESELVLLEELVRAGAPEALNSNAIGIFGPILIRHGTEEQKARFLPPMLDHSEIWCQGFSEPGAGSDLANVQARADAREDHLLVNGQKVWTSFATYADHCYALVRTDATGPKHAGITMVVVGMAQPGVSVRPLRTMAGGSEFAEVFFDDVAVPYANVVGDLNRGWPMAMEALGLERGVSFAERALRLHREVDNAVRFTREAGAGGAAGLPRRVVDALVDSHLDSRQLTSLVKRVLRLIEDPAEVAALAALAKLHWSESHQRLLGTVVDALEERCGRAEAAEWVGSFFYSRGETIYGGTSEIQRNTIGRAIGLPSSSGASATGREPRPRVRAVGTPLTEDQAVLRDGLDALLTSELTPERAAAALDGDGFSREVWKALADAGWLTVAAGPDGVRDGRTLLHLAEGAGTRLVPGPLGLNATLIAPLLDGSPAAPAGVVEGRELATIVLPAGGTPAAPEWSAVRAAPLGAGHVLDGAAGELPYGAQAEWILVPVEIDGRIDVALVRAGAERLTVGPGQGISRAHPTAPVVFDRVLVDESALLGGPGTDLRDPLAAGLALYLQWLDGESVGGAEEILRRTIEYVGQRRQFGVPVGSFQAVKHMLADAYADLELARGLAYDVAADGGGGAAGLDLMCSRIICARMYPSVIETCIQAHGGVGFTWEHQVHHWYRAALALRHHPFPVRRLRAAVREAVVPEDAPPANRDGHVPAASVETAV